MSMFSLLDLIMIITSVFYYFVMGFGFVCDVNRICGHRFVPTDIIFVTLWPVIMFVRALIGFFDEGIR